MELAVRELKINESTSVMNYDGPDPYQMIQVHDYQNVSFLRMNPTIKSASKQTIEIFSMAYPELLREKFFVNLPVIMGWVFTAMKVFLSKNTIRKFHPITNGANLAREFPSFMADIPKTYGGKGPELQENARGVPLEDDAPLPAAPEKTESAKNEVTKENATAPTTEEPKTEEPGEAVPTKAEQQVEGEQVGSKLAGEEPGKQEFAVEAPVAAVSS
jgi:phosphatidylinositol transfer protein SFH5